MVLSKKEQMLEEIQEFLEAALQAIGNSVMNDLMIAIHPMTDEDAKTFLAKAVAENPYKAIAEDSKQQYEEYEVHRNDPEIQKMVDELMESVDDIKAMLQIEDKTEDDDGSDDGSRH